MFNPKRIGALGASICEGVGDSVFGGWFGRLATWHLSLNTHHHAYNLGVSGNTLEMMLERIDSEVYVRRLDMLIYLFGLNDIARIGSLDNPPVSTLDQYQELITLIFQKSITLVREHLVITTPPIVDNLTTPVSWIDYYYTNADLERYTNVLIKTANQHAIPVLDIRKKWLFNDKTKDYISPDGLHPNPKGHQHIYQSVRKYLQETYAIQK